jgi:WD40 repeat protein
MIAKGKRGKMPCQHQKNGGRLGAASNRTIMVATAPGDKLRSINYPGRDNVRTFSPDLRFLACACHQDVDLFDTATGKIHATLPDHPGSVSFIAFSGDGKTAAVVVRTQDEEVGYNSEILVWDIAKQAVRARIKNLGFCTSVGVNSDGKFVVMITDKNIHAYAHELRAIDIATGKTTSTFRFERTQTPQCQAFSHDGKLIAVGCRDGSVQVFAVK